MKRKLFIAGVWGASNISTMEQLKDDADVEFLKHDFRYFFQIQRVWRIIHKKLGGHGKGILRRILRTSLFDKKYGLSYCNFDENEENDVVIFNSALLHYYSKEYFERLRRKHQNIRYILYVIDPMPNGLWQEISDVLEIFDVVMSMHPYNCNRYGFRYLPYVYAEPQDDGVTRDIKKTKLFFCGVIDDYRQKIIKEIVKKCEEEQIDFDFWLKPYGNNDIDSANVHYSEMPYIENVQRLKEADCILEVMHEGYVGITQRYLEAVVYNKRLITNNAEIKTLPYYDPRYIHCFHKVEDIDWNWLSGEVEADYQYKGDYSAQAWKKRMLKMLDEEI